MNESGGCPKCRERKTYVLLDTLLPYCFVRNSEARINEPGGCSKCRERKTYVLLDTLLPYCLVRNSEARMNESCVRRRRLSHL